MQSRRKSGWSAAIFSQPGVVGASGGLVRPSAPLIVAGLMGADRERLEKEVWSQSISSLAPDAVSVAVEVVGIRAEYLHGP